MNPAHWYPIDLSDFIQLDRGRSSKCLPFHSPVTSRSTTASSYQFSKKTLQVYFPLSESMTFFRWRDTIPLSNSDQKKFVLPQYVSSSWTGLCEFFPPYVVTSIFFECPVNTQWTSSLSGIILTVSWQGRMTPFPMTSMTGLSGVVILYWPARRYRCKSYLS